MRAPLRFAVPLRRASQQGTAERSAATASRRVAVKSSTFGSPQISPMTALREEHLSPSSIAHKASRASRASTWMSSVWPSPAGCTRPASLIAIRSWTHSKGLAVPNCGSRKPAQPPSRGLAVNSSLRVGRGGAGRRKGSSKTLGSGRFSTARRPAPATRDKPLATRLTTLLFYFCSLRRVTGGESMPRLATVAQDTTTRDAVAGLAAA